MAKGGNKSSNDTAPRRTINPESKTIFDQKFSKQIRVSKESIICKDFVAPVSQKQADLETLRREIARKDEAKIKQYMKDIEAPPVRLPDDELTQRMLMTVSGEFDQKSLGKIASGMNPKISQMMMDTMIVKQNNQRMERVWGPTDINLYMNICQGFYYLLKQQKVKDFMRKQGISPISVDDLQDPANKGIDLDDISVHANFYDLREYRENLEKRLRVSMEKSKLQEELYSDLERQKEKFLFGSTQGSKASPKKTDSSSQAKPRV